MPLKWTILTIIFTTCIGCTSTGKLTRKFSDEVITSNSKNWEARYTNTALSEPISKFRSPVPSKIDSALIAGSRSLWKQLLAYCINKPKILEVPTDAMIQLSLTDRSTLAVTAFQGKTHLSTFSIPVKRRNNYLILENKNRVIPIPIFYFRIKEEETILAQLKNNRLGIASYEGDLLWILVMGAGKDHFFSNEYLQIHEK